MTYEEMVQELWDREMIKELTHTYGLAAETADEERMASLYTEDATVDFSSMGQEIIRGREAILDFYRAILSLKVKPFFTNHIIEVNGDLASGTCSIENRGVRNGESLIGAGRLYDTYAKIEGEWKFSSRRIDMFYLVPLSEGWAKSDGLAEGI